MSRPLANSELALSARPLQQAGLAERFTKRWRLVGAGLNNVWRFGDLELSAASGRLLLRGQNGTGKTTALEALWPYLLDLNAARLAAGKARSTSLSSLMREGASGKRRSGHAWFTVSGPGEGVWSFGVRLYYSESASPPVKVIPFAVPGRPLHELRLHGDKRTPLTTEQFSEAVSCLGGQVFDSPQGYVAHLSSRLFATPSANELESLGLRLRHVRNPSLLADVSPQVAADVLRESLPGVSESVIQATADALAESDTTREAFTRDKDAAELLEKFRDDWSAHAVGVVGHVHESAKTAAQRSRESQKDADSRDTEWQSAQSTSAEVTRRYEQLVGELETLQAELTGLRNSSAYKEAGRLADLEKTLHSQKSTAGAMAKRMCEAAQAARKEGESLRRELVNLREDLDECMAPVADSMPTAANVPPEQLLSWTEQARSPLSAGESSANPGPLLVLHVHSEEMQSLATAWRQAASDQLRRAEAARLALVHHRWVESVEALAKESARRENDAAHHADSKSASAKRSEANATAQAEQFLAELLSWTEAHPRLAQGGEDDEETWTPSELTGLNGREPGQVLGQAEPWAKAALARAEKHAADLRERAKQAAQMARASRQQAASHRAEAADLRAGRLLPLPRPEWVDPGDEDHALGTAIEWRESFAGERERALLETALAASGLLSASLVDAGAATRDWRVDAQGPEITPNLSEVLKVDHEHPRASVAAAVLARIQWAPSALTPPSSRTSSGLVFGADGTFRAGVLAGRVPGAVDATRLPAASHVGARQRRATALLRATYLTERADELEQTADTQDAEVNCLGKEASTLSTHGRSFPSRHRLQGAESQRVEAARLAQEARASADAARGIAEQRRAEAQRVQTEWVEQMHALGLPSDPKQLANTCDSGKATAAQLQQAAKTLEKLVGRARDLRERATQGAESARELETVEVEARTAHRLALQTGTELRVLKETAGAEIDDILSRYADTENRYTDRKAKREPADQARLTATNAEVAARERLARARERVEAEKLQASRSLHALRLLLGAPGVVDAALDGERPEDDARLLLQVEAKLAHKKKTIIAKTLRMRADEARARLAGIWAIEPGEDHGELITYSLSHRDVFYTPPEAAAHAMNLKQQAEKALALAEEKALREFVIGRLPTAIGTAWTRIHDWVAEVNKKMYSAAASSGVRVQVRLPLRDDLSLASRTVHELSCKVSSAQRTSEQQKQLREALQSLLAASQGETMQQRVAEAVDVRDWVEVHYEVTRPGEKPQRWNSRTGLSGGERRLVVLAPMLAAVAAAYDRFGEKALRLVALDEVPAEVDEKGREGLARYLAELDLDLVCTSYLWDGCPGAWDGIDAHDLEAGPDGTVVAFPMLIRGLLSLPEESPPRPPESARGDGEPGQAP